MTHFSGVKNCFMRFSAVLCCLCLILTLPGCYRTSKTSAAPRATVPSQIPHTHTPVPTESATTGCGVRQVSFSSFGYTVAVLYDDGTVRAACPESYDDEEAASFAAFRKTVSGWTDVQQIWNHTGHIIGLLKDGTLVHASPYGDSMDLSGLRNVVSVAFNEPDAITYVLHSDGTVSVVSEMESDRIHTAKQWKNVAKLIPYYYYGLYAVHTDGTVSECIEDMDDAVTAEMKGAADLLPLSDRILVMGQDGQTKIVSIPQEYWSPEEIPNEEESLRGIVEAHPVSTHNSVFICGRNEAGDLLISGGEEWYNTVYAPAHGKNPITLSQFTGLAEVIPTDPNLPVSEVVALREDGTVVSLNDTLNPYFDDWQAITKLGWIYSHNSSTLRLYGLQRNGWVMVLDIHPKKGTVIEKHRLNDWQLVDFAIHPNYDAFFLGFRGDGTVVISGDQASVLNPEELSYE